MDSSVARDLHWAKFNTTAEAPMCQVFVMAGSQVFREPSLLELITACENVKRYTLFCLEHVPQGWFATMFDTEAQDALEQYISGGYRSTPEEAVARLWLTLEKTGVAARNGTIGC